MQSEGFTDSGAPELAADGGLELPDLARAFQAWLDERREAHARFRAFPLPRDFGERAALLCELQRELFDAGWARHGWPTRCGGLGGTVLHRAALCDLLQRNGYPPRHLFEHLDILPPALVRFGHPSLVDRLFLPTLRGDVLWCQGFSEPSAGSDLASLRTRAEATGSGTGSGYRIDGHKIWTSWAKWATHCLLLARTGTPEDRHRGLSAFVVELARPGVTVGPIRQANGTEELAEVFFDGVEVPEESRVGELGEGWAVAMHILAGERGSFTWLRQAEILAKLERLARHARAPEHAGALGESLTRLLALRCRARSVMEILARGQEPGPESSVSKVLVIDAEQHFYDVVREIRSPELELGTGDDPGVWQEHYLYSRASSIYGGSRQIQLNVIGRLMASAQSAGDGAELAAVRQSVDEAIEKSGDARTALAGLDWWSFAVWPDDELGREAFAAWFEAEGRERTTSPALSGVAGRAAALALAEPPDVLALAWPAGDAGAPLLACGFDAQTRFVVVDDPRGGVRAAPAAAAEALVSRALDPTRVQALRIPDAAWRELGVDVAVHLRARTLARIGVAFEILGAARALAEAAARHAEEREQFGQPIARFQAVQHLVAESRVDLAAIESLCAAALEVWSAGGGGALALAAKACAGRAGCAVAQRALQCFGAIGFTEEHLHPGYSRRIHTLDALLGSHYALQRELGRDIVRAARAPRGIEVWRGAGLAD